MIRKIGQAFVLDTAHTTYAFSILPGGHPEHLYYGRTIHIEHPDDLEILVEKHVFAPGNVNICEKEHAGFSLEDVRLEMSSYGKGDIREPFVEAILYDGAKTLDFRYEDAVITGKKDALDGLPGSYGSAGEVQQLCVTMVDRQYDLKAVALLLCLRGGRCDRTECEDRQCQQSGCTAYPSDESAAGF